MQQQTALVSRPMNNLGKLAPVMFTIHTHLLSPH